MILKGGFDKSDSGPQLLKAITRIKRERAQGIDIFY